MRRYLPILILLSLLLPLGAVGWLGLRLADQQQNMSEARFRQLLEARLDDLARGIADHLSTLKRGLEQHLDAYPDDWAKAASALQQRPLPGEHLFLLDPRKQLVYPANTAPGPSHNQRFRQRTQQILEQGLLGEGIPPSDRASLPSQSGWHSWYLEDGINLLFWKRLPDGATLGIELDRISLLSELIARLPANDGSQPDERIRLLDAQGRILYQWGDYQPPSERPPDAQRRLDSPLSSWQLHYHMDPARLAGSSELQRLQLLVTLASFALLLIFIAVVLYREVGRSMREASQRVNFVNQVSHELKTPLTNIRMYAELLHEEVQDLPSAARKTEVITSEARRLSRLIANVLGYARQQRNALRIHPAPMQLDDLVRDLVEQFRPALEQRGIAIELALHAPKPIHADQDAIAQIISNLVSNVEKYAANGGLLRITSRQDPRHTQLDIQDNGPGIPRRQRHKIFRPFYRIRNDLTEGVSGTGIGLGIARELARMHGGELELKTHPQGALFRVIMKPSTMPPDTHENT